MGRYISNFKVSVFLSLDSELLRVVATGFDMMRILLHGKLPMSIDFQGRDTMQESCDE